MIRLKNNAQSILSVAISKSDTSLRVSAGDGKLFPDIPVPGTDYFRAALSDNAGNTEFIKVTAQAGDILTVVRGEEGSLPQAWVAGTRIQVRMTAQTWLDMAQDHWIRLVGADGSVLVPTRLSNTSLQITGNWLEECHARRAVRIPGAAVPFSIASSALSDNNTVVTFTGGTLPAKIPCIDLGISQEMMPQGYTLSDAVNSDVSNIGASSKAVKLVYDMASTASKAATTGNAGIVQLNNTVNSTSTTQAATANAVKVAYDLAAGANTKASTPASASVLGLVTIGNNITVDESGRIAVNFVPYGIKNITQQTGSITLYTNTVNNVTINGATTFVLPAVNTNIDNQIVLFMRYLGGAINWGTGNYFTGTSPSITAGHYLVVYDHIRSANVWSVGAIKAM